MVMLTEAAVATALGVARVAVVVVGVAVAALVGTNCSTSSRGRNGVNLARTGLLDYFLPLAPQLFADQMGPRCYLGRLRRQVDRFNGWGVAKSCEATWYTQCRHWQITCYKVSRLAHPSILGGSQYKNQSKTVRITSASWIGIHRSPKPPPQIKVPHPATARSSLPAVVYYNIQAILSI